jgi:hypothetical protein
MMRRAYVLCSNRDHYFAGECCPFDGWGSPGVVAVARAEDRIRRAGTVLSIAALAEAGIDPETLATCIVAEFASERVAFRAMWLWGYVRNGKETIGFIDKERP